MLLHQPCCVAERFYQTIYGEMISLESNSDAVGLAMFILQRLLWNPDIAAQYRHAKVPNLYKDGNLRAPVIVLSELLLSGPKNKINKSAIF